MIRKVAAIIVMILSALGTLLCLALIIGGWVANEPVTVAVTDSLDMVDGYLTLADQTTDQVDAQLDEIQTSAEELANAGPEMAAEVQERLEQRIIPVLTQVSGTLSAIDTGITSVNKTISQLDRLPGVEASDVGDELESVDQRLTALNDKLNEVTTALADQNLDGERIAALATSLSERVTEADATVASWSERIESLQSTITAARSATPGLIDWTSTGITILFTLMGAGQVSLFIHGLQWFRTEPAA